MEIIAATKVGYKSLLLRTLLKIFDAPGGFEHAAKEREKQKRGCRGIYYRGKPHILDCMEMLKTIWDGEKYVSQESISRCWRKADILLVTWNADINNTVGSATTPQKNKVVNKDILDETCSLLGKIRVRTEYSGVDTIVTAKILNDS